MSQEAVITIGTLIGTVLATLIMALRQRRLPSVIEAKVKDEIHGPVSDLNKAKDDLKEQKDFFIETTRELIAAKDRQIDRLENELKENRAALRVSEQTANDLKGFITDQFTEREKGITREGELARRVKELESEVKDLRDAQAARNAASIERDRQIEQLQRDLTQAREDVRQAQLSLQNAQNELERQSRENEQLRVELEAERRKTATLQHQVEALMAEVESLKRQLSEQRGAVLGHQARMALGDIMKAAADIHQDTQLRNDLAQSIEQAQKPVTGALNPATLPQGEGVPLADRPLTDADRAAIADMRAETGRA